MVASRFADQPRLTHSISLHHAPLLRSPHHLILHKFGLNDALHELADTNALTVRESESIELNQLREPSQLRRQLFNTQRSERATNDLVARGTRPRSNCVTPVESKKSAPGDTAEISRVRQADTQFVCADERQLASKHVDPVRNVALG